VERQRNEAKRRRDLYLADRKPIPTEGQVAILVDDGIATWLTVEAAIAVSRSAVRKIVLRAGARLEIPPGDWRLKWMNWSL
jgi:predicted phosphoribosyltransferase